MLDLHDSRYYGVVSVLQVSTSIWSIWSIWPFPHRQGWFTSKNRFNEHFQCVYSHHMRITQQRNTRTTTMLILTPFFLFHTSQKWLKFINFNLLSQNNIRKAKESWPNVYRKWTHWYLTWQHLLRVTDATAAMIQQDGDVSRWRPTPSTSTLITSHCLSDVTCCSAPRAWEELTRWGYHQH